MGVESFGPTPGSKEARAMWAKASLSGAKKAKGGYSKKKMKSGTPKGGWGFDEGDGEGMNRDDLIAALGEHGIDTGTLKDAPDEALAEMLRVCEDKDEQHSEYDDEEEGKDGDREDMDDDQKPDEHDPFGEFAEDELPDPETDEEKKDYAERARAYAEHLRRYVGRAKKYMQKYCQMDRHAEGQLPPDKGMPADTTEGGPEPMADGSPVTALTRQPKKTTLMHQYSERRIADVVRREVQRALSGQVKQKMDQFEKFTEEQMSSQKKAAIEAFCEARLKAGKILPFELDSDNPANLFDRLMRADAKTVIRKFKENGKEQRLTELEMQMREIDQRPARAFSEQVRSAKYGKNGKKGEEEADIEVEKVEEAYDRFSENFKGTSKQTFVDGFKIERKHHPQLTAEDYLEALSI